MDWDSITQDAYTALVDAGVKVVISKPNPLTTFDPIQSKDMSGGPDITMSSYGARLDIKEGVFAPDLVLQASETILLSAFGIPQRPAPGDRGTAGGEPFVVIDSKPLSPGGVDITYNLLVKM